MKKWGNAPLRMSAPASSEPEKAVNGNVGLLCCRQLLIDGGGVFFLVCFGCMRPLWLLGFYSWTQWGLLNGIIA